MQRHLVRRQDQEVRDCIGAKMTVTKHEKEDETIKLILTTTMEEGWKVGDLLWKHLSREQKMKLIAWRKEVKSMKNPFAPMETTNQHPQQQHHTTKIMPKKRFKEATSILKPPVKIPKQYSDNDPSANPILIEDDEDPDEEGTLKVLLSMCGDSGEDSIEIFNAHTMLYRAFTSNTSDDSTLNFNKLGYIPMTKSDVDTTVEGPDAPDHSNPEENDCKNKFYDVKMVFEMLKHTRKECEVGKDREETWHDTRKNEFKRLTKPLLFRNLPTY